MSAADTIALMSLIIAVNALVVTLFLWIINKDKIRLEKSVKELRRHIEFTDSFIDSIVEWLVTQEKIERVEQGWIYKHINEAEGADYLGNYRANLADITMELLRKRQELMLHSNKSENRGSAYKQLCHAYGDLGSYELMRKLAKIREKKEDNSLYEKELKERINERINHKNN